MFRNLQGKTKTAPKVEQNVVTEPSPQVGSEPKSTQQAISKNQCGLFSSVFGITVVTVSKASFD